MPCGALQCAPAQSRAVFGSGLCGTCRELALQVGAVQAPSACFLGAKQRLWMQAYLVGDPVQLPATVISSRAAEAGYNVSLFKRLQSADFPVNVLDTQVRVARAL